ncbi:hypothetical protein GQX74_009337 [Glossina fuscipes]|nr:hypothetical protein GQX74_009337 [Glossina fuscipes]
MALNEEDLVYTWGYGILGFGPLAEQSSKPQRLLPPLFGRNDFSNKTHVVSIGCGVFHMGTINSDGLGHKKDQFFPFKNAINGKVTKVAYGCNTFYPRGQYPTLEWHDISVEMGICRLIGAGIKTITHIPNPKYVEDYVQQTTNNLISRLLSKPPTDE